MYSAIARRLKTLSTHRSGVGLTTYFLSAHVEMPPCALGDVQELLVKRSTYNLFLNRFISIHSHLPRLLVRA
jgi:hypothetical protein